MFGDDRDRIHRLELLGELPERFGVVVHAYVLMTNHDHLVLQTPRANLSAAMQWLNLSYSVWFNLRHSRLGPVFTRPFKAILVEGEGAWALELSRYVHLNPIRLKRMGLDKRVRGAERAGIAPPPRPEQIAERLKRLREYRWSSYGDYAGYRAAPKWLSCEALRSRAARGTEGKAKAYRRFVEDYVRQGVEEDWRGRLHAGMALGGAAFAERVRGWVKGDRREQPALRRWDRVLPFEAVVAAMEGVKGESWPAFRDRRGDPGRDLVLWAARRRCGLTLRALGEKAGGIDYLTVSKAIGRIARRARDDRRVARLREKLDRQLSNV
jgi:REP element-mobilizing transposase RayT